MVRIISFFIAGYELGGGKGRPRCGRRLPNRLFYAARAADVSAVGAPTRSPFASDVFADEDSVFRGTADERRIENAVEVVVAAHLFLVGVAVLVAPRVEDAAVRIEDVGDVGSLSRCDVEPVFGVDAGVREVRLTAPM